MRKKVYSYNIANMREFEKHFFKNNKDAKITVSNYSCVFQTETEKFVFANEMLGFGGMNIIRKVKIDVRKNIKDGKFSVKDVNPTYYNFNPYFFENKESKIFNTCELDINSAYLESAVLQRIISEPVYLMLKKISKKMRLRALGSLATKKTEQIYKDGVLVETLEKKDDELTKVWKMICKGCDEMIYNVIDEKPHDFIFYWFDNLFLRTEQKKESVLFKKKYPLDLDYQKSAGYLKILVEQNKKMFTIPYH